VEVAAEQSLLVAASSHESTAVAGLGYFVVTRLDRHRYDG
jgi:hypothetical protein